jgi:hypothetical protein
MASFVGKPQLMSNVPQRRVPKIVGYGVVLGAAVVLGMLGWNTGVSSNTKPYDIVWNNNEICISRANRWDAVGTVTVDRSLRYIRLFGVTIWSETRISCSRLVGADGTEREMPGRTRVELLLCEDARLHPPFREIEVVGSSLPQSTATVHWYGIGTVGVVYLLALVAGWLLFCLLRSVRAVLRQREEARWKYCSSCGYLLLGLRGVCCPECGRKFKGEESSQ